MEPRPREPLALGVPRRRDVRRDPSHTRVIERGAKVVLFLHALHERSTTVTRSRSLASPASGHYVHTSGIGGGVGTSGSTAVREGGAPAGASSQGPGQCAASRGLPA